MTDRELADKLDAIRRRAKGLPEKWKRDQEERLLERAMVENAKQIIAALRRG